MRKNFLLVLGIILQLLGLTLCGACSCCFLQVRVPITRQGVAPSSSSSVLHRNHRTRNLLLIDPIVESDSLKQLMLSSIRWYRKTLSPIMPPNCRFQPSCSNYGIQAIEEFGPTRGGILTAWRIFRCNPLGGSGYDPPEWPPCSYFRKDYNPPLPPYDL